MLHSSFILPAEPAKRAEPSKRQRVDASSTETDSEIEAESSDLEADAVPRVLEWRDLAGNVAEATVELEGYTYRGLMAEIDPGAAKQVGVSRVTFHHSVGAVGSSEATVGAQWWELGGLVPEIDHRTAIKQVCLRRFLLPRVRTAYGAGMCGKGYSWTSLIKKGL